MRREKPEFEQRLLDLRRVTRVVKGGRRFRFRATVVIGDRRGRVGVGVSKGSDVTDAISKAYASAKKSIVTVPIVDGTIPHDISVKLGSAKVLLKPAAQGRGLISGGAVRSIVDLAGIHDITTKSLGTANKLNVARATLIALGKLQRPTNLKQKTLSQEEKKNTPEVVNDIVSEKKTSAIKNETKKESGLKKDKELEAKNIIKKAPIKKVTSVEKKEVVTRAPKKVSVKGDAKPKKTRTMKKSV